MVERRQSGFTLIEVLLAVVLLSIIMLSLFSAFTVSYVTAKESRMLEVAQRLAELTVDSALTDYGATTMASFEPYPGMEGYEYRLELSNLSDPAGIGRAAVEVTVRYRFIAGYREFKLEAWRYGI